LSSSHDSIRTVLSVDRGVSPTGPGYPQRTFSISPNKLFFPHQSIRLFEPLCRSVPNSNAPFFPPFRVQKNADCLRLVPSFSKHWPTPTPFSSRFLCFPLPRCFATPSPQPAATLVTKRPPSLNEWHCLFFLHTRLRTFFLVIPP